MIFGDHSHHIYAVRAKNSNNNAKMLYSYQWSYANNLKQGGICMKRLLICFMMLLSLTVFMQVTPVSAADDQECRCTKEDQGSGKDQLADQVFPAGKDLGVVCDQKDLSMFIIGQIKILLFDQVSVVDRDGVRISLIKGAVARKRIQLIVSLFIPNIKYLTAFTDHDKGVTAGKVLVNICEVIMAD